MNTPAHVVASLLILGRQDQALALTPIVLGAILPDAPMFVFYFVEKILRKTPESVIWRQSYYQPHWQNFIDLFNSVPFILVGLCLAWWAGSQFGALLFSSMMLHMAGDLPLHHDDAHRHFFPFSNWRFHSPVSYWDPRHYGHIVSAIEILFVIVSCLVLFNLYSSLPGRIAIGLVGACYLAYFVYVLAVWA